MSAEQPAAEHYRQLINSGKFFLEYSHKADLQDKSKSALRTADFLSKYSESKKIAHNDGEKISYVRDNTITGSKRVYLPSVLNTGLDLPL